MKPIAIGSSHHRVARSDREGVHAVRRVSDVHERTERATRIDLRALAPENARTFRAGPFHEVSNQDSLADTGLAGHQHGPAPAADALAQKGLEPAHFGAAADEDGAQDPPIRDRASVCCHGALPALILSRDAPRSTPRSRPPSGRSRERHAAGSIRTAATLVDGLVGCRCCCVAGPVRVLWVAEYRLMRARLEYRRVAGPVRVRRVAQYRQALPCDLCRAGEDLA